MQFLLFFFILTKHSDMQVWINVVRMQMRIVVCETLDTYSIRMENAKLAIKPYNANDNINNSYFVL